VTVPVINERGPGQHAAFLSCRQAFVLLASYFALQALLRWLVSDSAELDESEQLLWTQMWSWGYGSDPPLYTWLQILTFHVTGTNVLGLALLKNLLLFGAFVATFYGAKEVARDEQVAVLAALSLLLFPEITWESQRDLTHSVLATALAAATFWVAVRVIRFESPFDYAALGVCLGLGTLSKYSYVLFALGLAASALTVPRYRPALRGRWIWLTIAIFFLITVLHFLWVKLSPTTAFSRPRDLIASTGGRNVMSWMRGLFSILKCAVMLTGVLVAVYIWSFRRFSLAAREGDLVDFWKWMRRMLLVVLLVCLAVVAASAVELRDRWFQPIVFLGAITSALLVRDGMGRAQKRRFVAVVSAILLLTLIILPGIPLVASLTRRPTRLNAPYAALCDQLRERLPAPGVIVADSRLVGGNLRLQFRNSAVVAPEFRGLQVPLRGNWLAVWDATRTARPSEELANLVKELRGASLNELTPSYVEAPCKYTRFKTMRLGYVELPR
jgi:4-amino-4-deoxy-L-arabinose transferase-like glycosyltransferase